MSKRAGRGTPSSDNNNDRGKGGSGNLARSNPAAESWTVTDNWPLPVPVSAAELKVVETYLGTLIDELFTRSA